MDLSVLWYFGWLLWLTLSSRVTNSGNMAHLCTMITCLFLESAIVWCVWVSSASIATFRRKVRRRRRWFAVIWYLVNSRFCVQLTVQFRRITNGSFHRYRDLQSLGIFQFCFWKQTPLYLHILKATDQSIPQSFVKVRAKIALGR